MCLWYISHMSNNSDYLATHQIVWLYWRLGEANIKERVKGATDDASIV